MTSNKFNEDAMDVEALQAQIDLSNSVAFDLVSSWMKPASSKGPAASVSSSIARDLEEYARRPPRLGLGASVSKASAATAREAAKLKGKLVGSKRGRGGDDSASASVVAQAQDEDGESRSAAILTKTPKLNGTGILALGLGKKDKGKGKSIQGQVKDLAVGVSTQEGIRKNKRKTHSDETSSPDGTEIHPLAPPPSKSNPFVVPKTPPAVPSIINLVTPSPMRSIAALESPNISKKKQKRKHKKQETEKQADLAEEWHGFSIDIPESVDLVHSPDDNSAEQSRRPSTPDNSVKAQKASTPYSIIDLTSTVPKSTSASGEPKGLPTAQLTRLLNLDGPPSLNLATNGTEERATSASPKKKKRRRGRARKNHGHGNEE